MMKIGDGFWNLKFLSEKDPRCDLWWFKIHKQSIFWLLSSVHMQAAQHGGRRASMC